MFLISIWIVISAAPVITNAPNSVGIDILKNATLPCEASGIPPPQTVWRRADGKPLDFQYRFTMLRSGTLFINGTFFGVLLKCRIQIQNCLFDIVFPNNTMTQIFILMSGDSH